MSSPLPPHEAQRIAALHRYRLLDTPPEQCFDDIARLAATLCGTPIALVSLVDTDRQWLKAKVGVETTENPREHSFCAHAILGDDVMVVENAQSDPRFATNPLVTAEPHIRFYAGAPLKDRDGYALGSLCVIDRQPRPLPIDQQQSLEALARLVTAQFEQRRSAAELAAALEDVRTLHGLLPICSYCKNIRNDEGYWKEVEDFIANHTEVNFSHAICPKCLKIHHEKVYYKMVSDGTVRPVKD